MEDQAAHLGVERRSLQLRGRWQERSKQAGWLFPGDWMVPEVGDMLSAQTGGRELHMAAKHLGASRALHGVGVRETMLDFSAFFEAAGLPADHHAMRDLVEGWVRENERFEPFSCTDVHTGLATMAHFERLIYELSLGCSSKGPTHTIASLYLAWSDHGKRLSWEMLAEMGRVFLGELDAIDARAAYHRGSVHILMPRKSESYEALFRCSQRMDALNTGQGQCTVAEFWELPRTRSDCDRTVAGLRHRRFA